MVSTKTALLNMPNIPLNARHCHLFPNINGALLSIGKFCDNGMTAFFDNDKIIISNKLTGEPVITGRRDYRGMYMLPLVTAPHVANSSIYSQRTDEPLVAFISASWGNPADSPLLYAATKGFLHSIPNLSPDKIRRFKPNSIESAKGHLDQVRQGIWSTHATASATISPDIDTLVTSPLESISLPIAAANKILVKLECSSKIHGDSTGRYPIISRKGNSKVLIGYSEAGNFIKSIPIKGDFSDDLIQGYSELLHYFSSILHDLLYLDNQTSSDLEKVFVNVAKISFTYAPPKNHRTLLAERAIRTWKNHFIATKAGLDPDFPPDLWDELLDQVDLTLNTLRSSNTSTDSTISAWDYVCGPYNYSAHPIGPLGAKVLVYETPMSVLPLLIMVLRVSTLVLLGSIIVVFVFIFHPLEDTVSLIHYRGIIKTH